MKPREDLEEQRRRLAELLKEREEAESQGKDTYPFDRVIEAVESKIIDLQEKLEWQGPA